ncbi:MAG: ImmA/IrrE family metallo-endopeptidase [Eubacterium sp.]|nr:ImmA/IrrE family metallo-endopeptidase [Eubacterium sp.]
MNTEVLEIVSRIEEKNKSKHEFSMIEIDKMAEQIRAGVMEKDKEGATPVIKLAEILNLPVFRSKELGIRISGEIHINDEMCRRVHRDQIIMINAGEPLTHQRFVVAHELGHYLFDYLGTPEQSLGKTVVFPYTRDQHEGAEEKRADRFAASLLMPKDEFIKEHDDAVDVDNRRIYVIKYLSKFYNVKEESVIKRIGEVRRYNR